jgi:hypothetical protein
MSSGLELKHNQAGVSATAPQVPEYPVHSLPATLRMLGLTATRDLRLGSGLTANRINLPYASELYLAFNISSSFTVAWSARAGGIGISLARFPGELR